ncbi:MAG: hypothetical protein V3R87_01845 [Dehalococcoidia bacterium]
MSDKIVVSLRENRLEIAPGASAETTATVRNAGDVVEAYSFSIEGIDPEWCSLSVSSASLFPGDELQVVVRVEVPRGSESKAGTYEVRLKALSARDPSLEGEASLTIQVQHLVSFGVDLAPRKVTARKGSYQLSVSNAGNAATTYTMAGLDAENVCRFEFGQHTVVVEPGATAHVPVTVRPRKRLITGQPKNRRFEISVTPHGAKGGEVRSVAGELVQPPLVSRWALVADGIAVAIIVLLAVFVRCGIEGTVTMTMSPVAPSASDEVTFTATSDLDDLRSIELFVNGEMVKECTSSPCTYTGGPYPEGTPTYYATATDETGNTWDNSGNRVPAPATSTPSPTPTSTAAATDAVVFLSPDHAAAGTTVTISGTGFQPDASVSIVSTPVSTTVPADATGSFMTSFVIDATLAPESYTIIVSDPVNSANGSFLVESSPVAPSPTLGATPEGPASIDIDADYGYPGDEIAIVGTGWGECRIDRVTVTLGETTLISVTPVVGWFKEVFTVPDVAPRVYKVTATDRCGVNARAILEVRSR